jgi:hypothetical protein
MEALPLLNYYMNSDDYMKSPLNFMSAIWRG